MAVLGVNRKPSSPQSKLRCHGKIDPAIYPAHFKQNDSIFSTSGGSKLNKRIYTRRGGIWKSRMRIYRRLTSVLWSKIKQSRRANLFVCVFLLSFPPARIYFIYDSFIFSTELNVRNKVYCEFWVVSFIRSNGISIIVKRAESYNCRALLGLENVLHYISFLFYRYADLLSYWCWLNCVL